MQFLRDLLTLLRRPARATDAYADEVLFAGWVNLPPLFREVGAKDHEPGEDAGVTSA